MKKIFFITFFQIVSTHMEVVPESRDIELGWDSIKIHGICSKHRDSKCRVTEHYQTDTIKVQDILFDTSTLREYVNKYDSITIDTAYAITNCFPGID